MNQLVENTFSGTPAPATHMGAMQVQSREMAETQAKFLMAQHFPRDQKKAMDLILNAFTRVSLCEKAQYQFARGGSDIAGPSIRAAEAIAQQWGNMEFGFREMSRGVSPDGVPFSDVEAFCTDLQSRNRRPAQFIVRHWRDKKNGQGYVIKDERDIYELIANQAQRRVRACILAMIPGDVVESAMEQVETTLKAKCDISPDAQLKLVDAFGAFGVTKDVIEKRIQRRLDSIRPAQMIAMKRIYVSLRDDMSSPEDWFDMEGAVLTPEPTTSDKTEPKVLPTLSDEQFALKLPSWLKAIAAGKKTPDAVIVTAELNNKLSDAQKATIHAASSKPTEAKPADAPVSTTDTDGVITMSYAAVADRMAKAKTRDDLDMAAGLIGAVVNLDQQAELGQLYDTYIAKLNA